MSFLSSVARGLVPRAYPVERPNAVWPPQRVDARHEAAHDGGEDAGRCVRGALIAVALLLALNPAAARADDASLSADQIALATEVVQAIGIQQVADAALGGLRLVLVQSLAARNRQPADKVAVVVDQVLVPDLRALEPQFIAAVATNYGHVFTVVEMQQILAFYQTPVGQKLEAMTPGLTQQMVAEGHAWIEQAAAQVLQADAAKLTAQGLSAD